MRKRYADLRLIVDQTKRLVASGAIAPSDKLLSVRAIATDLGVNPMTVSKAYSMLDQAGIVVPITPSRHDRIAPQPGRRIPEVWPGHHPRGVELDLEPGTVTGLLGRNGSAKTTLMRVANRADAGRRRHDRRARRPGLVLTVARSQAHRPCASTVREPRLTDRKRLRGFRGTPLQGRPAPATGVPLAPRAAAHLRPSAASAFCSAEAQPSRSTSVDARWRGSTLYRGRRTDAVHTNVASSSST